VKIFSRTEQQASENAASERSQKGLRGLDESPNPRVQVLSQGDQYQSRVGTAEYDARNDCATGLQILKTSGIASLLE